uniref:ZP domain-containing protein n=1 Tax=Trichuris muris TaxID=70415 RepID=A0A5S6QDE2_TRIMR
MFFPNFMILSPIPQKYVFVSEAPLGGTGFWWQFTGIYVTNVVLDRRFAFWDLSCLVASTSGDLFVPKEAPRRFAAKAALSAKRRCQMKVAGTVRTICLLLLIASCLVEANFIADKFAICEEQKVHFSISFNHLFRGVIYSDGHYGNPRCTYVNETLANRYDFAIPINECRSGRQENGSVQHNLIVQRDPKILSGQDQLLYIICLPTVNAQLHSSTLSPSVIHFDGVKVGLNLDSQAVRASMERNITYRAEIRKGDGYVGQPVQGELNVGEALSYVARIRGYHASNVRIGRCWASDEYSNLMLSDDNGCPMHAVKTIWSEFSRVQVAQDEVYLYNKIKAWAFPTSNKLNIFCNLHFCSGQCINLCSGPVKAQQPLRLSS